MNFRKIAFFILGMFLVAQTSWSDTAPDQGMAAAEKPQQATFGDVMGKVTIQHPNDTEVIAVHKGSTAMEGDRVTTGAESSATLIMFDNSEMDLGPDSALTLAKMRKPAADDKLLSFKLFVGRITAKVMKLASAQSSFEIDAGGVICGVRGTQFTMEKDAVKQTCLLTVNEGTVWARTNGGIPQTFGAGQHQIFTNLHAPLPNGPNTQNLKSNTNNTSVNNSSFNSNTSTNNTTTGTTTGSASTSTGSTTTGGTTDSTIAGNTTTTGSTNSDTSTSPSSPLSDPALQVITNNVQQNIKTNTNNTINSTQQNSSIGLHVGPNEVVP